MKNTILLVFCALLFAHVSRAQTAASYAFSTASSPFSSLTGATAATFVDDDAIQTGIPIGFTFTFCGTNYTTVSACSNGWVSLSNSSPAAGPSRNNTLANANTIGAGFLPIYWDDLYGEPGFSSAYYKTTGTAPNRVFTVEWRNWEVYDALWLIFIGFCPGDGTFQVKLYETTNVVEYHYGSMDFGTAATAAASIGISNGGSDYQSLPGTGASPTPSTTTFTTSLSGNPSNGRIYRWTPNCSLTGSATNSGPVCSGNTLTLTGTILTGTATTFSWTGPAGYSSNLQSPSITNVTTSRSGTYSFTATSASCSVTYTTTAVVDSTPTATIGAGIAFCSGSSGSLTVTGTAGSTVSYTIDGGSPTNVVLNALGTGTISTGVMTTGGSATTHTYALTGATMGGCTRTLTASAVVTVNPLPSAISGPSTVCTGGYSISLSSSPGLGTWSSSAPGVATVNPTTGVVTSGIIGTANIIYTLPVTGCSTSLSVTVNSGPPAITGSLNVCQSGGITTLANADPSGSWSISPATYATINSSGVVTGINPGSSTVTYTVGGTCYTTTTVVTNPSLGPISGPSQVCEGASIFQTHGTTPGTWSCTPTSVATIDPVTGELFGVAPGTVTVTYLAYTNCQVSRTVTVNALPAPIMGSSNICQGFSATLTDATTPGVWSSSAGSVASINAATGMVTGSTLGSATITYTATITGCYRTLLITVNPNPTAITALTTTVCAGGAIITLSNATPLGQWSSGALATATADASSGAVTGVSAGVAPITYTITATGCYTTSNVTVIPTPAAITGPTGVCANNSTITLSDATIPGTWSISTGGFATINGGGVVTGLSAGNTVVTYTGSNTCFVTYPVTVNPLPSPISGTLTVCQMAVTTLSSAPATGTWTTGAPFTATVGASGDVHGILGGTAPITYTLPTGCRVMATVTVNTIPGAITGNDFVCIGYTGVAGNSVAGGTWSTNNGAIVSIDASGTTYGMSLGTTTITYTTGTNGCYTTKPVSVNPIVPAGMSVSVNPGTTVCAGTPVTFTAVPTNGGSSPLFVWSVNGVILSGASSYTYVPGNGDIIRCWFISSYQCAVPDTASAAVIMTVNPIVTPSLTLSTGMGDTVCESTLTSITPIPVNGGSSPIYQWTLNMIPAGTGPIYPFIPNNGDVILCTMTTSAPCATTPTATASKILTVSPPLTPVVALTSSLGPVTCEGYPVIFTTAQLNGGFSPTYQWYVNGIGSGTGPDFTYPPVNGDVVTVTMTSSFPCLSTPTGSANISMTVLPITQPVGVVTAHPGYIIPAGMYDTFMCTIISGGGISPLYQWYKNAIPVAGETNSIYITNVLNTGDSISCEVTNTDQCSGVTVFSYIYITVGDNVGVLHTAKLASSLSVVPNPNNGSFTVSGTLSTNNDEELQLQITDMLGREIQHSTIHAHAGRIDEQLSLAGSLASGTYLINISSASFHTSLHLIVEQ